MHCKVRMHWELNYIICNGHFVSDVIAAFEVFLSVVSMTFFFLLRFGIESVQAEAETESLTHCQGMECGPICSTNLKVLK